MLLFRYMNIKKYDIWTLRNLRLFIRLSLLNCKYQFFIFFIRYILTDSISWRYLYHMLGVDFSYKSTPVEWLLRHYSRTSAAYDQHFGTNWSLCHGSCFVPYMENKKSCVIKYLSTSLFTKYVRFIYHKHSLLYFINKISYTLSEFEFLV